MTWRWHVAVLVLVLAVLAGIAVGCQDRPPRREPTPPSAEPTPTGMPSAATADPTPAATADVAAARRERDDARARLKAAEDKLVAAEEARDEARLDRLRLIGMWASGFACLGVFASVALFFLLPVGCRRWAVSGGAACMAVLVAAAALSAIVPYLAIIGLGLLVAGVGWGLWYLARWVRTAREAAEHADRLERRALAVRDVAELPAAIAAAKRESLESQVGAGVGGMLAALRGKLDRYRELRAAGEAG